MKCTLFTLFHWIIVYLSVTFLELNISVVGSTDNGSELILLCHSSCYRNTSFLPGRPRLVKPVGKTLCSPRMPTRHSGYQRTCHHILNISNCCSQDSSLDQELKKKTTLYEYKIKGLQGTVLVTRCVATFFCFLTSFSTTVHISIY